MGTALGNQATYTIPHLTLVRIRTFVRNKYYMAYGDWSIRIVLSSRCDCHPFLISRRLGNSKSCCYLLAPSQPLL